MSVWFSVSEFIKANARAIAKSNELQKCKIQPSLKSSRIVVVMVVRNELQRMAHFFKHYRSMGCDHFIVIDNNSDDGTVEFIMSQSDVSVYRARGSYSRSRYGNDWVNYVLSKHCAGKWIIYADPDELLVFSYIERRNIKDIVKHLKLRGDKSMRCLMIDMYSSNSIENNHVLEGVDPLEICNLFDKTGYYNKYESFSKTIWTKGGVRGRIFFAGNLWSGPALNKTPLVRWSLGYAFLKSSHQLWPLSLNIGCKDGVGKISGALLHFKFTSTLKDKIVEESYRSQHTLEYYNYKKVNENKPIDFQSDITKRYDSWKDLSSEGLIEGSEELYE